MAAEIFEVQLTFSFELGLVRVINLIFLVCVDFTLNTATVPALDLKCNINIIIIKFSSSILLLYTRSETNYKNSISNTFSCWSVHDKKNKQKQLTVYILTLQQLPVTFSLSQFCSQS